MPAFSYGSEYKGVNDADMSIVAQFAFVSSRRPADEMVRQFLNEVRVMMREATWQSGPKGIPLQPEAQAERLHPDHVFDPTKWDDKLVEEARDLAVAFLLDEDAQRNRTGFLQWLETRNVPNRDEMVKVISGLQTAQQDQLVQYFDMVSRQRFVIEPQGDGTLFCRKPKNSGGAGGFPTFELEPLDTSQSKAAFGDRDGMAIWVQGPSGRFYSSTESAKGKFHHSSFLAGHDVKAAGDWKVVNGKLMAISAASGHYQPPLESLQGVLDDLRRTSASLLAGVKVEVYAAADGAPVSLSADEFCQMKPADLQGYRPA